ncbi:Hypothetical protein NTJ_01299 [Nesidiocoris tenuis]|uniref:Uncharacterized protein n=1 Tax=Nesidiocoris tenuis TaxID=355587 RepID=A0ABN7AE08_9HEMI|nr:Hypothetical protein NTJ_01299 [Nesidiocoris tenuis]
MAIQARSTDKVNLTEADSVPKCSHEFCNEQSDPSNYPVGLPWASGLLKCLPGYCKKHKAQAIMDLAAEDTGEAEEEEHVSETVMICKCREPKPLICHPKIAEERSFIHPDDPAVTDELCFFLRMIMVADELDRWDEADAAKRKGKKKKVKPKNKNVSEQKKSGKAEKAEAGDGKPKKPKEVKTIVKHVEVKKPVKPKKPEGLEDSRESEKSDEDSEVVKEAKPKEEDEEIEKAKPEDEEEQADNPKPEDEEEQADNPKPEDEEEQADNPKPEEKKVEEPDNN